MFSFALGLALLAGSQNPYGPLEGLRILKPADTQNYPSTPAPTGATILFDGKSTDAFKHRDGKTPIGWKVTEDGFLEVTGGKGGDIVTKEKFSEPLHLHVEFRVPYMPKASGQGGQRLSGRRLRMPATGRCAWTQMVHRSACLLMANYVWLTIRVDARSPVLRRVPRVWWFRSTRRAPAVVSAYSQRHSATNRR